MLPTKPPVKPYECTCNTWKSRHGHLKWEFILVSYSNLNEYVVSGQLIMQIAVSTCLKSVFF